ncbi:cache domain-containing sensor histidine kinase [Paenibacillus lignilyticus]|uniref:Sensor histidine kinase n=1 Tax=Paenibacillus lignilyticus TaxID=1172615 RepID=A0ABS5C7M3_9BACL|nr:sensor histidine kinase [Paenibacillus lignilyticus]MBP3961986.1 sensor histidine kinase [Paenibacillus lignilyticus]
MPFWQSVRFKIVFGFLLMTAPMVLFLVYNNIYATKVVRDQISLHYNNLMEQQVQNNDAILQETMRYLYRMQGDPNIQSLQELSLAEEDSDYTMVKMELTRRFLLDTGYYNKVDTFFVYSRKDDDMFFATQYSFHFAEVQSALQDYTTKLASKDLPEETQRWERFSIPNDTNYLIKTVDLGSGVYIGALVQVDRLNEVLSKFDVGPDGAAFVVDPAGNPLTNSPLPVVKESIVQMDIVEMTKQNRTTWNQNHFLVITQPSAISDIHYMIVIPETYILKNLPYFQKMLYIWIPLTVAIVLSFYLLFLQRVMFKPLVALVRGMRKLGQGQFNVRMPVNTDNSEFAFMSGTFNQMAEQIEKLKIDVYEEQIRVQKAEYKHLQIQINPHFYMNSLNIIYNLAALKDYKLVQKMSLHLADYFRFVMLGHRAVVSLEDEIRHIEHYLEIQKIRYVAKLEYEIQMIPEHAPVPIAPLLLQPFVENSVIHGFNKKVQDGMPFRIGIYSEQDEEDAGRFIKLTIIDNGPGFPEAVLEGLQTGVELEGSGEHHLGIWNILRRFRMLYGHEGGITFMNGKPGGAIVQMRLPLERPNTFEGHE